MPGQGLHRMAHSLCVFVCVCVQGFSEWYSMCLLLFKPFPIFPGVERRQGYSGDSVVKSPPANAGDMGSNPRSRRSAGEGNDNPLHSILAWGMLDRGTWWATVHGITKESDMT